MTAYNWPVIVTMKTDDELLEMLAKTEEIDSEEIEAIKNEMDKRQSGKVFLKEPEFPPKPLEEIKKQPLGRSLLSLVLFIAAFHVIFKWELSYILALAGVLMIHELGHYLAMRLFKYTDLAIFFVPLVGAFATGSKENISQRQRVIILLSGPIPGVIIGTIIFYFGLRDQNEFLVKIANIFIFLNLFNLLPVMPLDGGQILKTMFFENREKINKVFIYISIALLTYYTFSIESYFLLIIPVFLLMQLSAQTQTNKVRKEAEIKGINLDKTYSELTDEEYWLIRDEIGANMKYYSRFITPKKFIRADNEPKIIQQVKLIIQKKPIKDMNGWDKILITVLWILTLILPFILMGVFYIILGVDV